MKDLSLLPPSLPTGQSSFIIPVLFYPLYITPASRLARFRILCCFLPALFRLPSRRRPSVCTAASQKKGDVSYCFASIFRCPSLAALSDDRREEFQPRWQRKIETKQLETPPFFVCRRTYRGPAAGRKAEEGREETVQRRKRARREAYSHSTKRKKRSIFFILQYPHICYN